MKIEAFGKSYCPYCNKVKATLEALKSTHGEIESSYTDMDEANISKEDLSARAGKTLNTIPQVWIDGVHLGGCDDTLAYLKKLNLI